MTDQTPVPALDPRLPGAGLDPAQPERGPLGQGSPDGAVGPGRLRGYGSFAAVFFENKLAIAGVVIVVFMFAFCFLGPLFYHTDQVHTNLNQVTLPPGAGHPLGTDSVGYDELGRLMVGGQTSLTVGLSAAIIATVIGSLWGAISGLCGRAGRFADDAHRGRAAVHPDPVPAAVHGHHLPADPAGTDHHHRGRLLAGDVPADPRGDALAEGPRVRAGGQGDGRPRARTRCSAMCCPTRSARSR